MRAASIVLLVASSAAANPPDLYGYGARAMGLAGAMTAAVDDTTANFYNPAALTRGRALELDTGYLLTETRLRLNGEDLGVDEGSGLQVGAKVPGEIGPVGVAFGFALFLPKDRVSRVRALPQYQPRFVIWDNHPQRIYIDVNLAVRPVPWLHLGGGVAFLTNTGGTLDLQGIVRVPNSDDSTLSTAVNVDFKTVRYPSAGVLVAPPEGSWSVGLAWREEVNVELDLGARVQGALAIPALLPGSFELTSFNTNLFTPRQIWLGATWRPLQSLLLSADLGWLDWSGFPAPTATVTLKLDIEGFPTEGLLPPTTEVIAPDFHDVVSVKAGVEWTARLGAHVELAARAGYAFEPSPAPDQPGATNYIDTAKHTIAAGLGVTLIDWNPWVAEPLSIDLGAQAIVLPSRDYRKADPADLIGDYSAEGELFTFSSTARWRF